MRGKPGSMSHIFNITVPIWYLAVSRSACFFFVKNKITTKSHTNTSPLHSRQQTRAPTVLSISRLVCCCWLVFVSQFLSFCTQKDHRGLFHALPKDDINLYLAHFLPQLSCDELQCLSSTGTSLLSIFENSSVMILTHQQLQT